MALQKYGAADSALNISGIVIENFGNTDPAVTIEDIDPRAARVAGMGGGAVRLDNNTRAKRLTVNLLPGSDEVRQLIALDKTRVDITATFSIVGGQEREVMFDGMIVSRGPRGRVGRTSVTDEQFVIEFNDSEET